MAASPRSLTATRSISAPWLSADRKKFRPIRPNPLMPTRTVIHSLPVAVRAGPILSGRVRASHENCERPRGHPIPPPAFSLTLKSSRVCSESCSNRARAVPTWDEDSAASGQPFEPLQASMDRCLRGRRPALRGQLSGRERRVANPEIAICLRSWGSSSSAPDRSRRRIARTSALAAFAARTRFA